MHAQFESYLQFQKDILGSVKVIGNYNKFSKNQITVIRNKKNLYIQIYGEIFKKLGFSNISFLK